jgi:hypothetical protein
MYDGPIPNGAFRLSQHIPCLSAKVTCLKVPGATALAVGTGASDRPGACLLQSRSIQTPRSISIPFRYLAAACRVGRTTGPAGMRIIADLTESLSTPVPLGAAAGILN